MLDEYLRRKSYLERYIQGFTQSQLKALKKGDKEIINALRDFMDDASPKDIEALLKDNARNDHYNEFKTVLLAAGAAQTVLLTNNLLTEMKAYASSEIDFTYKTLKSTSKSKPSAKEVIKLPVAGATIANTVNASQSRTMERLRREIVSSISGGIDPVTALRGTRVQNYRDGLFFWRDSKGIAPSLHQLMTGIGGNARKSAFKRIAPDRLYDWNSTLDGRACLTCVGNESNSPYKLEDLPEFPPHPRCLTGDTTVSTVDRIDNVFKRVYEGVMINIRTKTGRSIKITPNHPVLTRAGWKAAQDINCFDQLACIDESVVHAHEKDMVVSNFSNIFSSLNVAVNPIFRTNTPSATEHFHGDGIHNSEVEIVNTNSLGRDKINSIFNKARFNNPLILRQFIDSPFNPFGYIAFNLKRFLSTSRRIVGRGSPFKPLLGSGVIHSHLLLFASASKFNRFGFEKMNNISPSTVNTSGGRYARSTNAFKICFNNNFLLRIRKSIINFRYVFAPKNTPNPTKINAEVLGDIGAGNTVDGVHFDDVVITREFDFRGHVYNLENKNNWYLSNGIITHNCRCDILPNIEAEGERPYVSDVRPVSQIPKDEREDKIGTVKGSTKYNEWFARQPVSFKKEWLGVSRYELYKSGEFKLKDFVDPRGKIYTLEQLDALND